MIPLLPFYIESLGVGPFIVGVVGSAFGICSLIAGPILGDLSDKYGRRPILLLSQIGTFISFIMLALSKSLALVLMARILDGITSGNITVAQAYIADVTTKEERTQAMSLVSAAFGLGFIGGPLLSGILSGYHPMAPIYASAGFSFLSILGTYFFLKDSVIHKPQHHTRLNLKKYLDVLTAPALKNYFIAFFIFAFFFNIYVSGIPLFLERTFTNPDGRPYGAKEVGLIFSYAGVVSLTVQMFLIKYLVRKHGEIKVMLGGFLLSSLSLIIMGPSSIIIIFLFGMTINIIGSSILRPSISGILSKNATVSEQGLVFGINQTSMSIGQVIAPLLSGILIEHQLNLSWALLISALSLFGFIFTFSNYKNSINVS